MEKTSFVSEFLRKLWLAIILIVIIGTLVDFVYLISNTPTDPHGSINQGVLIRFFACMSPLFLCVGATIAFEKYKDRKGVARSRKTVLFNEAMKLLDRQQEFILRARLIEARILVESKRTTKLNKSFFDPRIYAQEDVGRLCDILMKKGYLGALTDTTLVKMILARTDKADLDGQEKSGNYFIENYVGRKHSEVRVILQAAFTETCNSLRQREQRKAERQLMRQLRKA